MGMEEGKPEKDYDESVLRKFVVPELVFGPGARMLAGRYARNFGGQKVLVVTDPGVTAAGWLEAVTMSLKTAGLSYVVFDHVTPNPRSSEVMAGAEFYDRQGTDVIVAVGGGSAIDCAKGIGIVSSNQRHILDFEGVDRVGLPMPPLICIPTTGGSSADVSQFAIINNEEAKVKIAIISKAVVPDLSLLDPVMLTTMPPYLSTCTAFDALTHAIEAYVSLAHSSLTDLHALEAVRLISSNLVPSIESPKHIGLRGSIMQASLQAGMAFSNASLGAVHAMAHSVGGFLDIPHGECNAILLEHVIGYNFDEMPDRFRSIGEAMGLDLGNLSHSQVKSSIVHELRQLKKATGITRTLGRLGVQRSHIPELAQKAMKDACMVTNPRRPSVGDIEAIYEEAL